MVLEKVEGKLLWEPSRQLQENSNIKKFMTWLEETRGLSFQTYHQLWKWSVSDIEGFWSSLWHFFNIQAKTPYDEVLEERKMPGARWFSGSTLNYAEHIFRHDLSEEIAVIYETEIRSQGKLTWDELKKNTAAIAEYLKSLGVKRGDRVVAYASNIHETLTAFLACASIGAVWSSCAPEFGIMSVVDRFKQIEPKVLFAVDGYRYGGKDYDRLELVKTLQEELPSLQKTIIIPYLHEHPNVDELKNAALWNDLIAKYKGATLTFEPVPFDHPLWILYSSGTTGKPKAIVHSQGGILLEHLKILSLQMDLKKGDRFFWYTTTGWMMWNVVVSGLLTGSTILLYDGNPGYPNYDTLWKFVGSTKMTALGTSASFLTACMKAEVKPKEHFDLSHLKSIGSTGSPLPPSGFEWVYENVKEDVWLFSTSGGTDLCTAFVGGTPLLPVHAGELQACALGASVKAYNDRGEEVVDEIGELVITEPMPSMPIYFWGDENGMRYKESYFDVYPGIWRHGDFIKMTSRGSCIIYGRSDATINRGGIRMGTSEIYNALESIPEVVESLVVDLPITSEQSYMPLFVVLKEGVQLSDDLKTRIKQAIRQNCSPRHVPNDIFRVEELPKTLNGKKLEIPIKKILMGTPVDKAVNLGSLLNPEALQYFLEFKKNRDGC
ncbi:acetoacetate--CoA ligase [Thermolongibacillus altinsuensis]|uniref:acetoacetate--CoA ligase n=1 Tax=Thermolongibacillus altinsuensis TaxID=575256 RepID=UPI00242A30E3|nr:acetoacetate--CoA ligase [Thermolongibacillus altinsuensis]GMB09941.1 acetoacetyl-CoA synthetase [Thermolongibacillus altinsuensis]